MNTTLTIAPAGTWNLDPVHSRVDFEVSYLAGTFKGHFNEIAAELTVADEHATLEGTTKVASIDVNEENLSAHLQSPDFFDAEQYPELRFTAGDIRLDGDRVVRLHHRVQELRDRDRFVGGETLVEIVSLQGSRHPLESRVNAAERLLRPAHQERSRDEEHRADYSHSGASHPDAGLEQSPTHSAVAAQHEKERYPDHGVRDE